MTARPPIGSRLDTCYLSTWCYAYCVERVSEHSFAFKAPGHYVTVERVVDERVAVVRFADGLQAPVLRRDLEVV